MSILSDILQALDRWEEWKAMRAAPKRLAALESRLAEMETRIGAKPAGKTCEYCGGTLKLQGEAPHGVFGDLGVKVQTWLCAACGKTREEERKP